MPTTWTVNPCVRSRGGRRQLFTANHLALFALVSAAMLSGAQAHFQLNVDIRTIHVEPQARGLLVLLRLPLALVLADKQGPPANDGSRTPAPYTYNRIEQGKPQHYVDGAAVNRDPKGLGRLIADGHRLLVDGRPVTPRVAATRVHPAQQQPRFASLEEARRAMLGQPFPGDAPPTYAGDAVADVALFYPTIVEGRAVALSSSLKPGLPGEAELANLILYHIGQRPRVFRVTGLLEQPFAIAKSLLAAAYTFVVSGIDHILRGLDHLLLVVCLTLGAVSLGNLLWRVTGFTLGHSVTLIAGFVGFTPAVSWFIPSVEMLIALSIVYAGIVVLMELPIAATFLVTTLIGLLHGFGFAVVLRELLSVDDPDRWLSLLSFNIGVELGQILIVLALWPLLYWLARKRPAAARYGRAAIALPCVMVAALWTGQRMGILLQGV